MFSCWVLEFDDFIFENRILPYYSEEECDIQTLLIGIEPQAW